MINYDVLTVLLFQCFKCYYRKETLFYILICFPSVLSSYTFTAKSIEKGILCHKIPH